MPCRLVSSLSAAAVAVAKCDDDDDTDDDAEAGAAEAAGGTKLFGICKEAERTECALEFAAFD